MSTLEQVIKVIFDHIGQDKLKGDTKLDDIDSDSLDDIEIVMFLEDIFEVELEDDLLRKLDTIQDIVDVVERVLTNK